MKRIFLLLLLLSPKAFSQAANYTSFIRQIQDGVTWLTSDITAVGTGSSSSGITANGSVFQLWTIDNTTTPKKEYLLDQKSVGAYLPKGDVNIVTTDPTGDKWGVKRTRIDKPFTVTTVISGLMSGSGLPDAASKVLLEQHIALSTNNVALIAATVLANAPVATAYLTTNATTNLQYARSSFYSAGPYTASGEEHFALFALADSIISQTQLDTDYVQVWPLASATITGITNGQSIKGSPPPLTVTYNNLYPSSTTRVIAYPKSNPTQIVELPKSSVVLDQKTPGSLVMTLTNYEAALPTDGEFVIKAVTTTPFATNEELANASGVITSFSVVVERTLQIRAMQVGYTDK